MSRKVVIIGAGFASLSAAAFMAKAGWDVTVIEKNTTPGGRARQLCENGFRFDMGPSWYWMPDVFERFFASFNKKVSDFYSLSRLDPSYRVYWSDEWVDIPAGRQQLDALFEKMEPGSSAHLQAYLKEAEVKYRLGMQDLVYKPGRSLGEFLDVKIIANFMRLDVFTSMKKHIARHFKNPKLQQLMEFPVLFLGALPEHTPALYSLMNYADIVGGTWYPDGGIYKVVEGMKQLAEEMGVRFVFGNEVKTIRVKDHKAQIVETASGIFEADAVISGADYEFTESRLLSQEYRSYSPAYWEKKVLAPSCLLYYVGLNKKLDGMPHHSLFFDVPFQAHAQQIYEKPQWPDEPLFYLSVPSRTDASVAPAGHENLMILIPVASGLENDSEELRENYFRKLVERIRLRTGHDISDAIVYKKTFSISDFISEYHAYKGNAYGLANVLKQTALLKPSCRSKKIKNLFFTGQFTVPGPGVPPSLISGEVVSKELLKSFH